MQEKISPYTSIKIKRLDNPTMPMTHQFATSLASIYGETVFHSNKNLDMHQRSFSIKEEEKRLREQRKQQEQESKGPVKVFVMPLEDDEVILQEPDIF